MYWYVCRRAQGHAEHKFCLEEGGGKLLKTNARIFLEVIYFENKVRQGLDLTHGVVSARLVAASS